MSNTPTPAPAPVSSEADASLSGGLKQRHLSMIAPGGVIGAGLSVGSGAGIAAAGPSARGGVPRFAVPASSVFGFACVLLSHWRPDDVFSWLLNMIGAVILVVWVLIALSQLRLRRCLERESPQKPAVRMWGFPWLTRLALAGMAAVFVLMAREPEVFLPLTGQLPAALSHRPGLPDLEHRTP